MNTDRKKRFLNLFIFEPILILLAVIFLSSCNSDNVGMSENAVIKVTALYDNNTGSQARVNELQIDSFLINIEDFELEGDDDDDDDREGSFVSDIELDGPFVINLIEGNSGLDAVLASVDLPEGNYEEIEFEINESEDRNSELYNKSVKVVGLIGDQHFEFWYDDELEVEIEFDDNFITLEEGKAKLINLQFNLNELFNKIDFSSATDGNEDGIIEISPNDEDGNRQLAIQIWERLDDIIDAFEDEFEDDDDDDDDND